MSEDTGREVQGASDAQDEQDAQDAQGTQQEAVEATIDAAASGGDASVRRQLDEQRDKYLRLAAEFDNFRKRATRERGEAAARGQGELVKQLLDALDDLARFSHLDPAATDAKTVIDGAEMVERKLFKALGGAGLERVDPADATFDPNLHEAVATEPAMSAEDDHVVSRVYQVGYTFNGLLLRPARVVVKQWNG